jgi:hypothetical protein
VGEKREGGEKTDECAQEERVRQTERQRHTCQCFVLGFRLDDDSKEWRERRKKCGSERSLRRAEVKSKWRKDPSNVTKVENRDETETETGPVTHRPTKPSSWQTGGAGACASLLFSVANQTNSVDIDLEFNSIRIFDCSAHDP